MLWEMVLEAREKGWLETTIGRKVMQESLLRYAPSLIEFAALVTTSNPNSIKPAAFSWR